MVAFSGTRIIMNLTIKQINEMTTDVLCGEILQHQLPGGHWIDSGLNDYLFHPSYVWRVKPTICVNGELMTKRDALKAWEESGCTEYEETMFEETWHTFARTPPFRSDLIYRWGKPKVEMWCVNGVPIVPSSDWSWSRYQARGFYVQNVDDADKLDEAIGAVVTKVLI